MPVCTWWEKHDPTLKIRVCILGSISEASPLSLPFWHRDQSALMIKSSQDLGQKSLLSNLPTADLVHQISYIRYIRHPSHFWNDFKLLSFLYIQAFSSSLSPSFFKLIFLLTFWFSDSSSLKTFIKKMMRKSLSSSQATSSSQDSQASSSSSSVMVQEEPMICYKLMNFVSFGFADSSPWTKRANLFWKHWFMTHI